MFLLTKIAALNFGLWIKIDVKLKKNVFYSYCRAILSLQSVEKPIALAFVVMAELKKILWIASVYSSVKKTTRMKAFWHLFFYVHAKFKNIAAVIKVTFVDLFYGSHLINCFCPHAMWIIRNRARPQYLVNSV